VNQTSRSPHKPSALRTQGKLTSRYELDPLGRLKEKTKVTDSAYTSRSDYRTSVPTVRQGYITTSSGIMSLMRVGL